MKTILQKVHLEPDQSFACRQYRTPHFETNWHIHEEFELIQIIEGTGTVMIGDYVGDYKQGDIYFIAGNLPHWFRKSESSKIGSAMVLHCHPDLLKNSMAYYQETKQIQQLLDKKDALRIKSHLSRSLSVQLEKIQQEKGFKRLLLLLETMQLLSASNNYQVLTRNFLPSEQDINPAIEQIIEYSFKHYLEPIHLSDVAAKVNMSIPSFCRFFKKNIKKTYFNFIQQLRIGHACKLLQTTDMPIMEICYESGYNSWAHFSKQFKQVKLMTPSRFRKQVQDSMNVK